MMVTALVLICSATAIPDLRDCTRDNAAAVMRVPVRFRSSAICFMYGRAYLADATIGLLAEGTIGRGLGGDERIKVICARTETVGDSIPALPAE